MFITILILLTLAAIIAAGRNLPSMLFAPILSIIQFLGSLIENCRENLKQFIVKPDPPGLIRYFMATVFTVGSMGWAILDAILMALSLKIIVSEKALMLFSTGNPVVNTFINRHLYSCVSIIVVVMLSIMIHFYFQYLARKYPQSIEAITGISVAITIIGLIVVIAFMRFYSSQLFIEMNKAIESRNYSISPELTSKAGVLSMIFFVLGMLSSGLAAFLGLNQFIFQNEL